MFNEREFVGGGAAVLFGLLDADGEQVDEHGSGEDEQPALGVIVAVIHQAHGRFEHLAPRAEGFVGEGNVLHLMDEKFPDVLQCPQIIPLIPADQPQAVGRADAGAERAERVILPQQVADFGRVAHHEGEEELDQVHVEQHNRFNGDGAVAFIACLVHEKAGLGAIFGAVVEH